MSFYKKGDIGIKALGIILVFSLMYGVFSSSTTLVQAQDNGRPLRVDASAGPSPVEEDEQITVRLSLNGNPDICPSDVQRKSLDIALVVDASTSMEDPAGSDFAGSKLEGAIQAIGLFANLIDQTLDRVSLIGFQDNGFAYSPLGPGSDIPNHIEALRNYESLIGGGTSVAAGISTAVNQLETTARPDVVKVIILLTDGKTDNAAARAAAADAQTKEIRIIAIGLGDDVDEALLREIVENNSDYYYAPQTSDLDSIYESIQNSIIVFEPASDIKVTVAFDASNFDLIEGSISPNAMVNSNEIFWEFDSLGSSYQRNLTFKLGGRVGGTNFTLKRVVVSYIGCGEIPAEENLTDILPVEVGGDENGGQECIDIEEAETWQQRLCGSNIPWPWIVGLVLLPILLLLWILRHFNQIRAWQRCGFPISRCAWLRLPLYLWFALLAGLVTNAVLGSICDPKQGIVFWRVDENRNSALYIKPTDPNLTIQPLTSTVSEDQCIGCHTTNDGNQSIAGVTQGLNGLIDHLDYQGEDLEFATLQGTYPSWSPDGTRLAYSANNEDIFIFNLVTGENFPLQGASQNGKVETMPTWSADGSMIAFVSAAGSEQNVTITSPSDILQVPSTGGNAILIPGASGVGYNYHPAYSPDGQWLAFTRHTDGSTTYGDPKAQIYLVPVEGGAPRHLQANFGPGGQTLPNSGNSYPIWSIDGSSLYFSSLRCDGQYDIYKTQINPDGSSGVAERLTTISDSTADEFGAHEVNFNYTNLLDRLLALWPWLLPVLLLWVLLMFCGRKRLKKEEDTVQLRTSVNPQSGELHPRQRFEVTHELLGVPVCEKVASKRNVDVVMLIDSSVSMEIEDMRGKPRIHAAQQAAKRFVRCVISQKERVAVVDFNSEASIRQALTPVEKDLIKGINAIEVQGATAMDEGLKKAAEVLERGQRENAAKVIILLSDGVPNDSLAALAAAKEIHEKGIIIMTIGIGEADANLLRSVSGVDGGYRPASDPDGLTEAFMEVGRQMILPPAATDLTFTVDYDAQKFEIISSEVFPRPNNPERGRMTWSLMELGEAPKYFRYEVKPLEAGKHHIDVRSEIAYKRCGQDPKVASFGPMALVAVNDNPYMQDPIIPPGEMLKIVEPEPVWQPDQALFIGIGGTGRWVLTHLYKNLMDAGAGRLPDGLEFLVIDTDEHEKVDGKQVSVEFAGVKISPDNVFVLDENLRDSVNQWVSDSSQPAGSEEWFKPRSYLGLDQHLDLSNGTSGRRVLPKVALLRNLNSENILESKWYQKLQGREQSTKIRKWIKSRCEVVKEDDAIRVFVVGSLSGGMSGVMLDVVNLTRQIGKSLVTSAGKVSIEGYIVDGLPFANLPGGQEAPDRRLANTFANYREIARWQLNPGFPLLTSWMEQDSTVVEKSFDDLILFSMPQSASINPASELFPSVADVISARLDRASGQDTDWLNQMKEATTQRHLQEHMFTVGAAGAYSLRLPIGDILRSLHARWAAQLLHTYLTGTEDGTVQFNSGLLNDRYLKAEPVGMVLDFLRNVSEDFGGIAPPESNALADYIEGDNSELIGSDDLQAAYQKADEEIQFEIENRLNESVVYILQGSISSGSSVYQKAARLQYALEFLEHLDNQLNIVSAKLKNEIAQPDLARIAEGYQIVVKKNHEKLNHFREKLSNANPGADAGLLERLNTYANQLEHIQEELNQIASRRYFWTQKKITENGEINEVQFMEIWWNQYLANKVEDYLKYLGWVISDDGVDLQVRIEDDPVSLLSDGVEAMVQSLMRMAGNQTHPVWGSITLDQVLKAHEIYKDKGAGTNAFQQSDVTHVIDVGGDTGIAKGRMLVMASKQVLSSMEHEAYFKGIQEGQTTNKVVIDTERLPSTDRFSTLVVSFLNAIRVDRTTGYKQAQAAYDRQDEWDATQRKFNIEKPSEPRAVFKPEALARILEMDPGFIHLQGSDKLHPLVVAGLDNPYRAELFALALADGLVELDEKKHVVLDVPGEDKPITLLESSRLAVDQYVEAYLRFCLERPDDKAEPILNALAKRYASREGVSNRMKEWLDGPQAPLAQGLPDSKSLGQFVSTMTRFLNRTNSRRWQ